MRRLVSLLLGLAILAVIYWRIDVGELWRVLTTADPFWLAVAVAMFVPMIAGTALRLDSLTPTGFRMGMAEATRLVLAASVLNMVLPSKMGDLAKAYFMRRDGGLDGSLAISLVVFEKACDMLSLLAWCLLGLAVVANDSVWFRLATIGVAAALVGGTVLLGSRQAARWSFGVLARALPARLSSAVDRQSRSWEVMHGYVWTHRMRAVAILAGSVAIWLLHLVQIGMFFWALGIAVSFPEHLARAPLAILAGLAPLTLAGVGTRDAALIALYSPFASAPTAAAVGLLCTARYLVPALLGLPVLGRYWNRIARGPS